jgi:hypothetical protein
VVECQTEIDVCIVSDVFVGYMFLNDKFENKWHY